MQASSARNLKKIVTPLIYPRYRDLEPDKSGVRQKFLLSLQP
ncbi:hypothetical protein AGR2A_pa60138 [Agrobacterium genomosp. 2 str. CFBP 5494]|uniref:Uncharacterized protein n=1 Tax=Agrobacterium genomosp. 2 str. CFBP 5494 TaxID=1183436 RepID=A0A9W5F5W4_9HYPH|nr:hypothetical protein AGR2A_pa60138 [Agrobacterium genomosp. 2 str. CFBP 5494]CUX66781.1 hypothetical protein AGR5A_pa30209 [Agrobacterium genomosp. 5 str. CFBP 6626]